MKKCLTDSLDFEGSLLVQMKVEANPKHSGRSEEQNDPEHEEAGNIAVPRRLSIKLCLRNKSSSFLKAGLEHGVELRKGGGNRAGNDSPSTILQR
jgi:hypothetical protein